VAVTASGNGVDVLASGSALTGLMDDRRVRPWHRIQGTLRLSRLTLCLSLLVLGACRDQRPSRNRDIHLRAEPDQRCFQPLDCMVFDCSAYDAALAAASHDGRVKHCHYSESGSCGDLKYLYTTDDAFVSERRYFRDGKLIAVRGTTDALRANPACKAWTHYGEPVSCTPTPVTIHCTGGRSWPTEPSKARKRRPTPVYRK